MIKGDKSRYSYDEQLISQLFYTIQNLNDKKILNKMANMADKELNKSRDAKCLIYISMWRHCVANLNSECIIILIVTQNYSIRLRSTIFFLFETQKLRSIMPTLFATFANFGENKKTWTVKNELRS